MLDPQKSKLAGGRQSVGPFAQFGVVPLGQMCPGGRSRKLLCAGPGSFSGGSTQGLVSSSPVTAQRVHLGAPPLD